jgi:hypothetical protein
MVIPIDKQTSLRTQLKIPPCIFRTEDLTLHQASRKCISLMQLLSIVHELKKVKKSQERIVGRFIENRWVRRLPGLILAQAGQGLFWSRALAASGYARTYLGLFRTALARSAALSGASLAIQSTDAVAFDVALSDAVPSNIFFDGDMIKF